MASQHLCSASVELDAKRAFDNPGLNGFVVALCVGSAWPFDGARKAKAPPPSSMKLQAG